MNPAVSKYMREMQARSAKSRWSGLTAAEKSAAMKALRAKGKRKPNLATPGYCNLRSFLQPFLFSKDIFWNRDRWAPIHQRHLNHVNCTCTTHINRWHIKFSRLPIINDNF